MNADQKVLDAYSQLERMGWLPGMGDTPETRELLLEIVDARIEQATESISDAGVFSDDQIAALTEAFKFIAVGIREVL